MRRAASCRGAHVAAARGAAARGWTTRSRHGAREVARATTGTAIRRIGRCSCTCRRATRRRRRSAIRWCICCTGSAGWSGWTGYAGHVKPAMDTLVRSGSVREMISSCRTRGMCSTEASTRTRRRRGTGTISSRGSSSRTSTGSTARLARPESRGLAGHSMGGYGTFAVGMRHGGDVYGALYAMSGCCTHFSRDPGRPELWTSSRIVARPPRSRRCNSFRRCTSR